MTNPLTVFDNIVLKNASHGKPISMDIRYVSDARDKPIVVFIHGFKGFKDWGHWNLIAEKIAKAGYCVVKFNLSHNGTTPDHPMDFVDLDAFSNNTYSIELDDIKAVLDHLFNAENKIPHLDLSKIYLVGHSRGGGLALIKGYKDSRISGVVTWASVSDYATRWPEEVREKWKKEGVHYIYNGRTKQNMPLKYSLIEDFIKNRSRLDIKNAVSQSQIPILHIHGSEDPAVKVDEAYKMFKWNPNSNLEVIEGADHVFNGKHPFTEEELPDNSQQLVDKTLSFLDKISK